MFGIIIFDSILLVILLSKILHFILFSHKKKYRLIVIKVSLRNLSKMITAGQIQVKISMNTFEAMGFPFVRKKSSSKTFLPVKYANVSSCSNNNVETRTLLYF